jgi:hypothetical protein
MALVVVEKQPGNANVCNEYDNNRPEPKQQGRVLGIDKVDVGDEAAVGDDRKKGEEATASRAGANAVNPSGFRLVARRARNGLRTTRRNQAQPFRPVHPVGG